MLYTANAASGGSGGGQGLGCYTPPLGSLSGMGGTAGSAGLAATSQTCSGWNVGNGQGPYTANLKLFTRNLITPGPGGNGNLYQPNGYVTGMPGNWWPGGGGGGGVLLNSNGPNGGNGQSPISNGYGGNGYGAGGGAGGSYWTGDASSVCYAGGRGADGLVYIEWWVMKQTKIGIIRQNSENPSNILYI